MEKMFYTIKELAELLSVSRSLIYKQVDEQKIPARRIGSRILIPIAYVEHLFEN